MPDKKGRITGMESRFIAGYVATGDATYAADKAGYAHPRIRGAEMVQKPALAAAIRDEVNKRLDDLVILAADRLQQILRDQAAPNKDVIAASKVVFTHWGAKEGQGTGAKDLGEMSGEELHRRIAELQGEAAQRARPILDLTPDQPDDVGDDVLD